MLVVINNKYSNFAGSAGVGITWQTITSMYYNCIQLTRTRSKLKQKTKQITCMHFLLTFIITVNCKCYHLHTHTIYIN